MSTRTRTASELIAAYGDAWNAHDANACGALFAEDGVREWMVKPILGINRFDGREAVIDGIRGFMDALPDLRVEIGDLWEISGGAILTWRVVGTHTADWGGWTAQGEAVEFPGVSVYTIADGLITREEMYYDTGLMTANWRPPAA